MTPSLLSTPGARLAQGLLSSSLGHAAPFEEHLLHNWGKSPEWWWSEYTLYRLALEDLGLFEDLHEEPGEGGEGGRLSCHNVWWEGDLPFDAGRAFGKRAGRGEEGGECGEGRGGEEEGKDEDEGCLFAVVQSTSGVRPEDISKQLEAIGIDVVQLAVPQQ